MEALFHPNEIAEIISPGILITDGQSAIELIYNPLLAGADKIILHKHNLSPDFFTLSSGIAGDVLQKFVNYRCRLAIVGRFTNISNSLSAFIAESNRGKSIYFAPDVATAIMALS